MFGGKFTVAVDKTAVVIEFDKASVIAAIAFVGATCACFIISQALLMIIRGHTGYKWPRTKGFIMLICGLGLLAANLIAVLRNDVIVQKITHYLEYIHI